MKTLITLFAILSLSLIAAAQPPNTLWQRAFGGSCADESRSVQQTADGGYVITGFTYSYGAGNWDVYLIKMDAKCNLVWQRTFGGSNDDRGYSVQQTTDGGYVIAGFTNSYGSGYQVYLIKTDVAGNQTWQRTYGGSNRDYGCSVQQTTDGGYVIAGFTNSYGAGSDDVYLIKTDTDGDTVWTRTFGGSNSDIARSVQQTTDGGYVIAGFTNSSGAGSVDVYLIKTDTDGDTVWTRTFGSSNDNWGCSVQQTSDGGYVIAGSMRFLVAPLDEFYLIKTDAAGDTVWTRTFGGDYNDYGNSVQQTSDGGYVIAGSTSFYGGHEDLYLIKTDAVGDTVWTRTFGESICDEAYSVQQTTDGGYIIAGWTSSNGLAHEDIYLIKTDAGGEILDINTSPLNPPIIIPANGGSFHYNINVHNWTTQTQTFSVWNKIRAGSTYYPVFDPVIRTLQGGANPYRVLRQTISATIPSGTLYFISYIGTYPSTIQDSSFFTITKLATGDGGPWIAESYVTGDFFDEYEDVSVGAHGVRPSGSGADQQGVQLNAPTQPQVTDLHLSVIPNPFNPTTTIRFTLPQAAQVQLEVFDVGGCVVGARRAVPLPAGTHQITFNGSGLPSGIYLYRLQAGENTACGKMVLMK